MRNYVLGIVTGSAVIVSLMLVLEMRPGEAQGQNVGSILGAGDAGELTETLSWKNLKGAQRSATMQRVALKVPSSYGKVVGFDGQNVWFEDADGGLRNAIIGGKLVKIDRDAK